MRDTTAERLMASTVRHQAPWFAFIVHLRARSDLDEWSVSAAMDRHTGAGTDWRTQVLTTAPPVIMSTVSFRSHPARGEIVLIPRLPEDIIYGDGRKLIARAVEIAWLRGARVIGLGGLTAPATRGGSSLLERLPPGVTLTNGNAFTAAVACENVLEACAFLGKPSATVALLGSTGSVGSAVSQLLVEHDLNLILIGRSTERARAAAPVLGSRAQFESDLAVVDRADVVLVLTSDRSAQLRPEHFTGDREHVVIDIAHPPNIEIAQRPAFLRRRVRVVRGGWVQVPGIVSSYAPERLMTEGDASAPPNTAPACLAETWLSAVSGIHEHAVGNASADLARTLTRLAARRGVRMRSLAFDAVSQDREGAPEAARS